MAGKARETYDESVAALHQWLQFLDDKQVELQAQMERLRNKGKEDEQEVDVAETDKPEAWL
jgi:hypothetical protein